MEVDLARPGSGLVIEDPDGDGMAELMRAGVPVGADAAGFAILEVFER